MLRKKIRPRYVYIDAAVAKSRQPGVEILLERREARLDLLVVTEQALRASLALVRHQGHGKATCTRGCLKLQTFFGTKWRARGPTYPPGNTADNTARIIHNINIIRIIRNTSNFTVYLSTLGWRLSIRGGAAWGGIGGEEARGEAE